MNNPDLATEAARGLPAGRHDTVMAAGGLNASPSPERKRGASTPADSNTLTPERSNGSHTPGTSPASQKKQNGRRKKRRSEDEDTPLLSRGDTDSLDGSSSDEDSGDDQPEWAPAPEWPGTKAFEHLPWYKRPSVPWLLPSLFVHTLAFGGILVPKLTLILNLICRDYFADQALQDPNFLYAPIIFDGSAPNPQCDEAIIQKLVSEFTLGMQLTAGLVSMMVAPKLGALSDRYGRTKVIAFCGLGVLLNEAITVLAATYPDTVSVNWILVGAFLDGLSGTFITAAAITNAYAADCTPPERRGVTFGWIHGCLFTGIALGPFLASAVMKATHSAISFFYVALGVHAIFLPYILFIVPESLTKDRQMAAREAKASAQRGQLMWSSPVVTTLLELPKELFIPLSILWPRNLGTSPALRRNLALLAAIDTVLFGVAMGAMTVVVYYSKWMFKWNEVQSSNFLGTVSTMRVFSVLVLLPIITRIVRGKYDPLRPKRNTGSDMLDIWLIRTAIILDICGFVGYVFARQGAVFVLSGAIASLGGFGSPTMQSSLTKHAPPTVTGQLLGAVGLLHALARVVAPLVFNLIYAQTVEHYPQAVFVCLGATFFVAFLMSLFLKPHGMFCGQAKLAKTNKCSIS